MLGQFRQDYDRFVEIVTQVVELIRARRPAEARELQATKATPLADRLERLTNQLVNKAEADMVAGIEASKQAYESSRYVVIGFAVGSILKRQHSVGGREAKGSTPCLPEKSS